MGEEVRRGMREVRCREGSEEGVEEGGGVGGRGGRWVCRGWHRDGGSVDGFVRVVCYKEETSVSC